MRRFSILLIICTLFFSCKKKAEVITIWTDRAEMASCVELFNLTNDGVKATIVYRERLATSLPPAKDEERPDIVLGSLLKNSRMAENFSALNSIFQKEGKKNQAGKIDRNSFYKPLLDYGKDGESQLLIPVSFNLPIMIFSNLNRNLVSENYVIELDEIRETAAKFNKANGNGIYTNMGYAPSWNANFIYTAAKMNGVDFHETLDTLVWNESALSMTVDYLKEWTAEKNTSTNAEQDFSFKYLFTPSYKQISSGRCLFAYSTTDEFFSLAPEQIVDTDFRWLTREGTIFAEDDITTAGIYRKSAKKSAAKKFLAWLLSEETQRKILDRNAKMGLGSNTFGICHGFSSIKSVNERHFPAYYTNLIGNLPGESAIQAPFALPPRWQSMKERVLIPYLSEVTKTDDEKTENIQTIEARLKNWSKQFE